MQDGLRIRLLAAAVIALLTLLAPGIASAEQPIAPAPSTTELPEQCGDVAGVTDAGIPDLGTPEPTPLLSQDCPVGANEVYFCLDNDTGCGGCSSGYCAMLAYERYISGYGYHRTCSPNIKRCVFGCILDWACNSICED